VASSRQDAHGLLEVDPELGRTGHEGLLRLTIDADVGAPVVAEAG
jgi:hypothetical protein